MALIIILNGQSRELAGLEPRTSLAAALEKLELKADRIAVERNGEIVSRRDWEAVLLESGDKLEVVHFVGGGCQQGSGPSRHLMQLGVAS